MIYSLILLVYIQRRESDFNPRNEYSLVISYSTSSIQALVSFVLAGFVTKVVNEWRIQRQTYGTLVGKSRSFMILACAYIQVQHKYFALFLYSSQSSTCFIIIASHQVRTVLSAVPLPPHPSPLPRLV